MSMKDTLHLNRSANELENVRVRDEELKELDQRKKEGTIPSERRRGKSKR